MVPRMDFKHISSERTMLEIFIPFETLDWVLEWAWILCVGTLGGLGVVLLGWMESYDK